MTARPLSVRSRLTIWYSLILAGLVVVFSLVTFFLVKADLYRQLSRMLESDYQSLSQAVLNEPDEVPDIEAEGPAQLVQIVKGGKPLFRSPAFTKSGLPADVGPTPPGGRSVVAPSGAHFRMRSGLAGSDLALTVALEEDSVRRALRTLSAILLMALPIVLGLAGFGGFLMAGRLLHPVTVIAGQAEKISAESLSARLRVDNPRDEFGRLATVFNAMLERLEDSFDRLKRFTADASHEMRTPLTVIKSVGEVALHEELDASAYRDRIGSMLEDVDRLTRLVDDLLTLARADSGAAAVRRKALDAAALAGQTVEDLRPLAEEKRQVLSADTRRSVLIRADEATLRLALVNLLDNAIKFTPEQGSVIVRVETRLEEAFIEVTDSGPGIPVGDGTRIFDRFYRDARDRSGKTGGTGLGLAIAKWAVEVNGGRIEWESREREGSTFRLVFPVLRENV